MPVEPAVTLARPAKAQSSITAISRDKGDDSWGLPEALLKKVGTLIALVTVARLGVFDRLPGVDVARFSESVASNGILGYVDNITGGSISNVGVFSLGIIPAINASIFLQVLTVVYPSLKKMQREDGAQVCPALHACALPLQGDRCGAVSFPCAEASFLATAS